jgi:hypothetical protein
MEDTLIRRHRTWESAAKTKQFSWRIPLLTHNDDMTLATDRELLRGMLKQFQKNPKRFKLFDKSKVVEATLDDAIFDIGNASSTHLHFLMDLSDNESDEADTKVAVEVKRGPGRPKRKSRPPGWYMVEEPIEPPEGTPNAGLVDKSATPDTGGRPKRQAARLSFASGIPVQRTTRSSKDEEDEGTPAPRRHKSRASKIIVLPVSLPASPEINKNVAKPSTPVSRRLSLLSSHSQVDLSMEHAAEEEQQTGNGSEVAATEPLQNGTPMGPQGGTDEKAQAEIISEVNPSPLRNGPGKNPVLAPQHDAQDVVDTIRHDVAHQNFATTNNNIANMGSHGQIDQINTPLLELQRKHAVLQESHDLLDVKYRRWRVGAVENSKLLFEQEEDLTAHKAMANDLSKAVKQLSSDNARLGAELALARGMVQYNPGLLKQTLLRSSLTPDVVERLFSNPDFIELLQPRPANGEVILPQPLPLPLPNPDSARPKKRRRITAADAANDADAEEARQKKLTRVIAPTIKRLEKSRFKLSAADVENVFDADTAESKRFLDSLIDFAKLPIDFDEALVLIRESQQDRKQGRVVVPQLRLSDPAWAPWDVKTAQKRYMQREGMVENENGEIVRKKPKSMEEMVADAKAVREAAAKEVSLIDVDVEETQISEDDSPVPVTDETANTSASRRGGRSESQTRRVWERHEALRREREQREQELQRAAMPPLDMTDPLQVLAASMGATVNGSGNKGRGRPSGMNGRRRSGSPRQYQRREASEDVEMDDGYEQAMELSD